MPDDFACPICSGPTLGLSPVDRVTRAGKPGWEAESCLEILGRDEVQTQLRLCRRCFHTVIYPKFDTAPLYAPEACRRRKEVYEAYEPGAADGAWRTHGLKLDRDLPGAARDFRRFAEVAAFAGRHAASEFAGLEEIRVLDWGGGDGYVGSMYARALQAVTWVPAQGVVYDPAEWAEAQGEKVGPGRTPGLPPCHVLVLSNVLEHTHDPVGMLRAAAAHLAGGGVAIAEVPDENYTIAMGLLGRRFGLRYHVAHFSRRSLHAALAAAGLSNVHTMRQRASSYRGHPCRSILGIGLKGAAGGRSERRPGLLAEALATARASVRVRLEAMRK
jgi:hypothetical protein